MKAQLKPLTGLRGLAALWVFFYHARFLAAADAPGYELLEILGAAGYLGVDLFFILSGFVIAYSYVDRHLERSLRAYTGFLWKRLARIYPAHLAALALFAASLALYVPAGNDLSFGGLLQSLTLTQAWDLPADAIWNSVAWSISCEWAAYLAFPLIAVSVRRLPVLLALGGSLGMFVLLYGALRIVPSGDGYFSLGILRIAASFTAGVFLHRVWVERRLTINSATVLALVALTLGTNLIHSSGGRTALLSAAPVLGCVVVYGLATATGLLKTSLSRLEYAGKISYSFYLVHVTVLSAAGVVLRESGWGQRPPAVYVAVAASLVAAIGISALFYRFIEQPARREMLSLLSSAEARDRKLAALSPLPFPDASPLPGRHR